MAIPRLKRTVDATALPVSIEEAKAYGIINQADDGSMVEMLIQAATNEAENISGLALMTSTWRLRMDWFPAWEILLPGPVQSVSSVTYYDADGTSQTFASSKYEVDTDDIPARLAPTSDYIWPATNSQLNAVTITFVRGYESAAAVPAGIRLQIMALAQWWYNRPDRSGEVPDWFTKAMSNYHHGELGLFDIEA